MIIFILAQLPVIKRNETKQKVNHWLGWVLGLDSRGLNIS